MNLYAHQQKILDRAPARCLLCWETGTGKSLAAMELAKRQGGGVLVICPKSLKEKWYRDMEAQGFESGWRILTKEEFRKHWKELERYPVVIVDEAHHFSGMTSAMSKALLHYFMKHQVQYRYLLTATPFMSSAWNVYRLAQMLGYAWNYWTYYHKFFHQVKMGSRMVPVARNDTEEELALHVHKIGDVVKMEECIDVPPQIFETEYFETNTEQKKAIKELALNEVNPVVKFTRFHQIENGSLKGDEYNKDKFFNADKHDRIIEMAQENKKIAVFCRYNLQIDSIHSLLKSELKDKLVYIIQGATKDRDGVVQEIEKAESCVVLINASCSEGYELPSVGVIVFASLSFSYKDYVQAQGRFLRINKPKKNVFIHLINSGSVDEAVWENIKNKEDFDMAIYAKKHG